MESLYKIVLVSPDLRPDIPSIVADINGIFDNILKTDYYSFVDELILSPDSLGDESPSVDLSESPTDEESHNDEEPSVEPAEEGPSEEPSAEEPDDKSSAEEPSDKSAEGPNQKKPVAA
jgi:hypothetical protein